jgi:hypothetical protein
MPGAIENSVLLKMASASVALRGRMRRETLGVLSGLLTSLRGLGVGTRVQDLAVG